MPTIFVPGDFKYHVNYIPEAPETGDIYSVERDDYIRVYIYK